MEQFPRGLPHESAERSMYHIRTVEQVPQALPSQAELIIKHLIPVRVVLMS